ncbi:MAG: F0F1 ATP synthase subunit delta [Anaerolineae bacterium]|nr:F0F1 ATP synthase subunit delta [Anaerolineae bacterium]
MLNLDLPTVIFQVINFLVFFGLLYWLLFKPVTATIRQRRQEKERALRDLERERQAVAVQHAALDERLSRLDEETASMIALAREQAEEERVRLLGEAREEVEHILVEAQADAYRIRSQAVDAFHSDLVDAILDVSGTVIRNTVPESVHDALIRQLSERIWELGRTDIERVEAFRGSLGEREPTAHVTTAESLQLEQQGLLARTLTALADRHVDLEVQVDPSLVAGVRVRIGDIIVDSSIAGQMDELRDKALEALNEQIERE